MEAIFSVIVPWKSITVVTQLENSSLIPPLIKFRNQLQVIRPMFFFTTSTIIIFKTNVTMSELYFYKLLNSLPSALHDISLSHPAKIEFEISVIDIFLYFFFWFNTNIIYCHFLIVWNYKTKEKVEKNQQTTTTER